MAFSDRYDQNWITEEQSLALSELRSFPFELLFDPELPPSLLARLLSALGFAIEKFHNAFAQDQTPETTATSRDLLERIRGHFYEANRMHTPVPNPPLPIQYSLAFEQPTQPAQQWLPARVAECSTSAEDGHAPNHSELASQSLGSTRSTDYFESIIRRSSEAFSELTLFDRAQIADDPTSVNHSPSQHHLGRGGDENNAEAETERERKRLKSRSGYFNDVLL